MLMEFKSCNFVALPFVKKDFTNYDMTRINLKKRSLADSQYGIPETDFYADLEDDELENEENDIDFDNSGDSKTQLD